MPPMRSRFSSERGAVLIQVAVCLLVLLAFSAFVVDYGVMWASRGQVQTAADAGALAGAISMAYETEGNLAAQQTNARKKAQATAKENFVWGEQPDVDLTDITFPACPPGAPGPPDTCVRVDAFRNQARDNPLTMFFGNLVGVGEQGVRATATAQIVSADTTECLRPWAVIDRWNEFNTDEPEADSPDDDFLPYSTYDKYSTGKGKSPPQENDLYIPPSAAGPGTGFRLPDDQGRRFAVKTDSNTNSTVSPGWFRAIRIPRLDGLTGGNVYRNNIESCGGLPNTYWTPGNEPCPDDIGNDDAEYWATQGCYATEPGNMVGPTRQGVETIIATDPDAVWVGNGPTGYVDNSIHGEDWLKSKRIVPIGVIDIDWFMSQDPSGANGVLRLVNIYGFFIEGMGDVDEATGAMTCCSPGGKAVVGRVLTLPGTGAGKLHNNATFLRSIILVR
jgi:putative Flp pilus-assembly TadE/G-like protein